MGGGAEGSTPTRGARAHLRVTALGPARVSAASPQDHNRDDASSQALQVPKRLSSLDLVTWLSPDSVDAVAASTLPIGKLRPREAKRVHLFKATRI